MTARARFPDFARSRALLIGTATYQDASLPALPAAARNLTGLTSVLADPDRGGWPTDRITVISDPITPREIGSILASVAEQTSDTLLVYYAGHGLLTPKGELYLTVRETVSSGVLYSGLPFEWVREAFRDSPAANRVLILDCCFSGRVIESMTDPATIAADTTEVTGTYTLTATTGNLPAQAPSGQTYTAFTGELLDLLTTGIPDGPAELTFGVIYPHLRQRLIARGLPRPQQRGTDTADQLALVRNPAHARLKTTPQITNNAASQQPGPTRINTALVGDSYRLLRWLQRWLPHSRSARTVTAVISLLLVAIPIAVILSIYNIPVPSSPLVPRAAENVTVNGSPTFARMTQRGAVIIGVKNDQPGLGYLNPKTNKYQGFDVEIARLIAAKLGFDPGTKIEYEPIPSAAREQAIINGQVDYYVGTYTINDARKKQISFAGPYYVAGQRLLVRADDQTITVPTRCRARGSAQSPGRRPSGGSGS